VLDALQAVADARGVGPAETALAWLHDRPGVTSVVLGARTTAQLRQCLAAVGLHLSAEETAALDAASDPQPADYPYGDLGAEQRTREL
jgi:aryl-alcohol dehydrogenase-like predicted oxidoreductase